MMIKNKLFGLILIFTLLAALSLAASPASAQEEGLSIRLSKVIGYASFGASEVQGSMKLDVSGPANLQRVAFFIDGQPLGEATQAPFRVNFNTANYPMGPHTLTAVGYTADGRELHSKPFTTKFVTAQQGLQAGLKFALPLLIIVFGVAVLSMILPMVTGRGRKLETPPGEERKYGSSGGTICPRCRRPFPLHFYTLHLGPAKLERCPYCGRMGLVTRRSLSDLRAAERAELEMAGTGATISTETEEEKLRKELEESRYRDV